MDSTEIGPRPLVGVLLFDDVEVLDFAGPFEVFSGTQSPDGQPYVDVITVGPAAEVVCRGRLRVRPDYLSRVVSALEQRGGVVTVPYYGVAADNLWSRLAATAPDSTIGPPSR